MNDNGKEYEVEVGDDDDASNDDEDAVQRWKRRWGRRRRRLRHCGRQSSPLASTTSSSSCSSSSPILSSPSSSSSSIPFFFVPHYLQTLSVAILSFSAFICIVISIRSCQFLTVAHTYNLFNNNDNYDTIINDDSINDINGLSMTSSLGIFCKGNEDEFKYINVIDIQYEDENGDDIMLAVSRAFTCISILFSIVLSLLAIGINTTFIPPKMTTRLWNGRGLDDGRCGGSLLHQIGNISFLSAITFAFQLPVFLLLDSYQCKNTGGSFLSGGDDDDTNTNVDEYGDATSSSSTTIMLEITNQCTLGAGSTPFLVSMGIHVALALYVYWKDCPDWREEYDLWKIMKQQRINCGNNGEKGNEISLVDEERGGLRTMTTAVNDDNNERQVQHPAKAITKLVAPAMSEQSPSRQSLQQQAQLLQSKEQPTTVVVGVNQNKGREEESRGIINNNSKLVNSQVIGTRNNPKTFSPPPSPSTPPPPPSLPPPIESISNILHDLDTSLLTSSICSSREGKKRELSKFLREERLQREEVDQELDTQRKQFQLHPLPRTVVVAPCGSGNTNGVGDVVQQPTCGAVIDRRRELTVKNASPTRPPIGSIRINRKIGGIESNIATAAADASTTDAEAKSKSFFIVDELEWPDCVANDYAASPSRSMRIKMMKSSSPLTKFSQQMAMIVDVNNIHNANQIIYVVSDDGAGDENDDVGVGGSVPLSNDDNNQSSKIRGEGNSSLNSIIPVANGSSSSAIADAAASSARIVTPEKEDHDPEIDVYPSDGSLSTLSLATDDYRSTDDEDDDCGGKYVGTKRKQQNQDQQQQVQQQVQVQVQQQEQQRQLQREEVECQSVNEPQVNTIPKKEIFNFLSDGYSSEDSELSAVIAGVQKLNRKTSGKITPLNKRRRRKRGSAGGGHGQSSSACSMSANSYSSHGSLLDEVIVEEGELNSSNEGVAAAMIVNTDNVGRGVDGNRNELLNMVSGLEEASSLPSSASPNTTTKKKDRRRRKKHGDDGSIIISNSSENDYGENGSHRSINSAGSSDSEDSMLSRAARGRRSRIVTQRQSRIDPEGEYEDSASFCLRPISPDGFPPEQHVHRKKDRTIDSHRGINNRPPPIANVNSNKVVDQTAWQARKVRMMRLRMIRGQDDNMTPAARGAGSGDSSSSDGDVDDDFAEVAAVVAKEKVLACGISRAKQGVVIACGSDEDSI